MPFYSSLGEGSPTKIDYRKKGTLILTSLLEDLDTVDGPNPGSQQMDGISHPGFGPSTV